MNQVEQGETEAEKLDDCASAKAMLENFEDVYSNLLNGDDQMVSYYLVTLK